MSRNRHEHEAFPMPAADEFTSGYSIGLRWPHSLRRALGIAAAERKTSIAGYIEAILLERLVRIGLIEAKRPADEEAANTSRCAERFAL